MPGKKFTYCFKKGFIVVGMFSVVAIYRVKNMKIKELKNKIVLAELDPKASYIMLVNRRLIRHELIKNMQIPNGVFIYVIPTDDVDKSLKFVEIPRVK